MKAFFSDIDGTLLDSNSKLPDANKQAAELLKQRGIPLVVCSARSPKGMKVVLDQLDYPCVYSAFGGALTLDGDNVLDSVTMSRQDAKDVYDFVKSHWDTQCFVYDKDNWYVDDVTPAVNREAEIVAIDPVVSSLDKVVTDVDVYKFLYYQEDGRDFNEMQRVLSELFPRLNFTLSSSFYMEVTAKGVDKARCIEVACRHYGIECKDVVAFGDNYNDIPMSTVARFVAVANAPDEVKKHAACVCDSNNDGGVGKYILQLLEK